MAKNDYVMMPREMFDKIVDYFFDRDTDDGIPIIAEIKNDLVKEYPEEFED